MWHLRACKISVSLSFMNWIKIEMILIMNETIFYCISESLLATLTQRYDKNNHFFFAPVQKWETKWNFTGFCQLPHFMIVFNTCINLLKLSWIKMSIFEEYGSFEVEGPWCARKHTGNNKICLPCKKKKKKKKKWRKFYQVYPFT